MFDDVGTSHSAIRDDNVILVGTTHSPVSSRQVQHIWAMRKARLEHFPTGLFADPGWDLLLYLYAGELAAQRLAVKDAVFGSNVPEATALRWIARLEAFGLCARRADPVDKRRQFISLTKAGMQTMDEYFASLCLTGRADHLAAAA